MSGCSRGSHAAPLSAPVSSSQVKTSFSSPASGRQPASMSASAAASSAATWLFMSFAPFPHAVVTQLSRPRIDLPLGRVGEHGVHVTQQAERGPVGAARHAGYEIRPPGHGGKELAPGKPASSRRVRNQSWAGSSFPGGLTVLNRISRWRISVVRRSRAARSGTGPVYARPVAGLAHREAGAPNGRVALLVHGYSESSYMWRHLMPVIAERLARRGAGPGRYGRFGARSTGHVGAPGRGARAVSQRPGRRTLRAGTARLGRPDRARLGL